MTSAAQSAEVILEVLTGVPGAAADMVVANTAAALLVSGKVADLKDGVEVATSAIRGGKTYAILEALIQTTHSLAQSSEK